MESAHVKAADPGLTSGLFVGIRFALVDCGTKPDVRGLHPMVAFNFEPILVNSSAPGRARVLRTFDDIGLFISDSRVATAPSNAFCITLIVSGGKEALENSFHSFLPK